MSVRSLKEWSVLLVNNGNHYPDEQKQLILLKAHKRKSWRQEHYLLYEKDYRQNNCKRIISLDEFANDKVKALKDEKADIDNILYQRYLHNALTEALDSLPVIERQIIEECFFYNDVKRKTYEELGEKHNLSKGAYYNKLCRILRKLRTLLEQYSEF